VNSSSRTSPWLSWIVLVVLIGLGPVFPTQSATSSRSDTPLLPVLPRFAPEGKVFTGRLTLRLGVSAESSIRADAQVHFTVDGSEPDANSPVAKDSITIARSTLVRARVYQGGRPVGPAVAQSYAQASTELGAFTGNLPLVVIQTHGQEVQHETRKVASLHFIEATNGRAALVATATPVRGEIWWRGKSSLRYLKRSLGLKTRDDAGKAHTVALLGFPADSDWVLYAPYPDKTLLRDVLAYDLSRQMGHYASRTKFVEVFINEGNGRLTMEHYMGVYVLEEKIKRAPHRVAVQKLGTNDNAEPLISGGYIVKKDHGPQMGEVEPSLEGRPNWGGGGGNSGSRYGFPTGPGGFPADPRGFLPTVGGERARGNAGRSRGGPGRPPGVGPLDAPLFERMEREVILKDGRPVIIERQVGREGRLTEMRRSFRPGFGFVPGVEESFQTGQGIELYYVEPKEDEITPAQKQWLRNYFNEFEQALYGPSFTDPQKGYAAYIDADSFIDYHLLVEVTKNIDGFRFSTYFQKDRGGRIRAQPVWDWNLSFGNANGKQGWMEEHWYWPQLDDEQYSYYRRLFEDAEFAQRYVDRWGQLKQTVFSVSNVMARIDAHVLSLGDARIRNFSRWPILGRKIWPNYYVGETFEDEIRLLKEWTRKRLVWIEAQFTAEPQVRTTGSGDNRRMTLHAPQGDVYYTLDGTDPRVAGGQPAPHARRYQAEPVRVSTGALLTARTQFEGRWSPPVRAKL
jgi:hypothetical protein